uniref:Glycine N-acyltransferase-like protein n=1 Tax=Panagrolaimus davidi TaxID=227884 RepID=A0A914PA79_9BILA
MLRECKTKEELQDLFEKTKSFPNFLNVHSDIAVTLEDNFPEHCSKYFIYEEKNGALLVILFAGFSISSHRPELFLCCNLMAEKIFKEKDLWKVFDKVNSEIEISNKPNLWTLVHGKIGKIYNEWFEFRFPSINLIFVPCFKFFMTKEQQSLLVEECKNEILLANGYYFDDNISEKDMEIMIETWKFCDNSESDIMKSIFKHMPISLIRDSLTDEPVSFEHSDTRGCLNHLLTFPLHRNKGLGTSVEKNLCLKMIQKGMIPYKFVETTNFAVAESNIRSKYWTCWKDMNGPVIQYWMQPK